MNKRAKLCLYIFLVCAFFALSVGGYFLFNTANDQVMVGSRKFQVFNAVAGASRYSISIEDNESGETAQAEYEVLKEPAGVENEFNFTVSVTVGGNKIAQEQYIQQITQRQPDTNKIDCKIKNYTINFFEGDEIIETRSAYLDQMLFGVDAGIFCCVVNTYFDNLFKKDGAYNLILTPINENGEPDDSANQQKNYNYSAFYKEDFLKRDDFFYGGDWYDYVIENEKELQALVHWAILYRQAKPATQNGKTIPGYLSFFVNSSTINPSSINRLVNQAIASYPEYDALEYQNVYAEMKGNLGYLTNFRYYLAENFTKTYLDLAGLGTPSDYNIALNELHHKDEIFSVPFVTKIDGERTFAVDDENKKGVYVFNSEQLYMVVQNGEKPLFSDEESVVFEVWENALSVLSQINNSDLLSDYEKALNIYRYITGDIVYDWVTYKYMDEKKDFSIRSFGGFSCFYLEGVFLDFDGIDGHYAVCDGLAKAYSLLCNIEGIDCTKINGKVPVSNDKMGYHAWNRIHLFEEDEYNLEEGYYYVDPTWGEGEYQIQTGSDDTKEFKYYQILTHTHFLFKHPSEREILFPKNIEKDNPSSEHNYYQSQTFEITIDEETGETKTIDCIIESDDELIEILTYAQKRADIEDSFVLEIFFSSDYLNGANSEIHYLLSASEQEIDFWLKGNDITGDWKKLSLFNDNKLMFFKIDKAA